MAAPQPRSFSQILSDMLDVFLSRSGLISLKIGPILGILEAASQSDVRSTQDVWNALQTNSVDNLSGDELQTEAMDEDVAIIAAQASSGNVNFTDVTFNKISTVVFQGAAAPIPGTTALIVANASNFPATGSVYIGRDTVNYEGPIAYSAITAGPSDLYYTLTLSSGVTKFHNVGESVILAQGGNRNIAAGTIVQTPQSNGTVTVQFSTLYNSVLLDGENLLTGVLVVCQTPGSIGNVSVGAISQVLSQPFVGATVSNPSAFTNGFDTESDDSLRERIKNARASRTQGTALAITSGIQGIYSTSDNKTLVSSSLVTQPGAPTTLYIDDGTGYQETVQGVAQEILIESALGGEQLFQLASPRPTAKAFLTTTSVAPFPLISGNALAVLVGGVLTQHVFSSDQFNSISNATAFEVASSINSDPTILFSARLSDDSTTITIFARSDVNEDLEVVPAGDSDANDALAFPTLKVYTLRLFKNDVLLYKDGIEASLLSNPQSSWSSTITSGDTLIIQIDGTAAQTITVSNSDFINNNTGYTSVSATNTLTSWATVLNTKVAGATFTVSTNKLQVISNLGANSRAQVSITGGTLTTKNMFPIALATGANDDYTLDRNLGQLRLTNPLLPGDQLVAATSYTRAYIQSPSIPSANVVLGATGNLWFVIDGSPEIITTGINGNTAITVTSLSTNRARYTVSTDGTFSNVEFGDWVIIWDTAFTDQGQFVVSDLDTVNYTWFEVERATVTPQTATPANSGIVFVRTTVPVQDVQITAGTYSLTSLVSTINSSLIGGTASIYRTTQLRVTTNTYGLNGNIMLVTADLNGQLLTLPTGILVNNDPSHFAVIESTGSENGTPKSTWTTISSVSSLNNFVLASSNSTIDLSSSNTLAFRKRLNVHSGNRRFGRDAYSRAQLYSVNSGNISIRGSTLTDEQLVNDRVYSAMAFGLGWDDTFSVILDNSPTTKNYTFNTFRNIKPVTGQTYGNSLFSVLDVDNSNNPLTVAFGILNPTLFNDFSVYMHARGKSHSITANKTILWRYGRYGSEGNSATVSYINPSSPSQSMSLGTYDTDGNANITVTLPSGSARTGLGTSGQDYFVDTCNASYTATVGNVTRSSNVVTVTLSTTATTNCHTLNVGDNVYQQTNQSTGAIFTFGPKSVTAVTATSFSYNESGSNGSNTINLTYLTSALPAGTTNTVTALTSTGSLVTAIIGSHFFTQGQTIYFEPGHFDSTSGITVAAGAKILTSVASTNVSWNESTGGSGAASLISGVAYTVSLGQCQRITEVYYKAEAASGGGLSRSGSGVVTATIQTTPIFGTIPFTAGSVVYLSPGEANFPSGPKIVASVSGNTFTYAEAGTATTNSSTEFFSPASTDPNFVGGGNPVQTGDIVHIDPATSFDSEIDGNFRVNSVLSTRFSFLLNAPTYNGNTNPESINNVNNIIFFPINPPSATSVVSFITANGGSLVSAVLVPNNGGSSNTGAATISTATVEEYYLTNDNASSNGTGSISVSAFPFFDGLNAVQADNLPNTSLSQIQLKDTVSGELSTNNDFNNEVMRLVPTTAVNMVNYLSNSAIGGLGNNGIITTSTDGSKVQIGSQTIGSASAVQVTGGTANQALAAITGSSSEIEINGQDTYGIVTVPSSQIQGFTGHQMVQLQGNVNASKPSGWSDATSANTLTITASVNPGEYLIEFDNTITAVNQIQVISNITSYQVEKQGNYAAYIYYSSGMTTLSTSIRAGDWVYINSAELNPNNIGYFQLIRVDPNTNTFWVQNPNVVEQVVTVTGTDYVKFLSYSSALPGDTFSINTTIFGTGNVGSFTVSRISESGATTNANQFYVFGSLTPISATSLGTSAPLLILVESTPIKLVKKIKTIIQNSSNANFTDVILTPPDYTERASAQVDTVMTALDKFGFNTNINVGLDGYSYNTGLLAQVNLVVYGDESNPATYPGIIASGANVNISGPLILRVQVSIAYRPRSGVNIQDLVNRIQSAVATVISQTPVGQSIPICNILTAAGTVDGVYSVSMISPTYNSSDDLIVVQPNQKPLVINIDQDITLSLIGT